MKPSTQIITSLFAAVMFVLCSYLVASRATMEPIAAPQDVLPPPAPKLTIEVVPGAKAGNFRISGDRVVTNQTLLDLRYQLTADPDGTIQMTVNNQSTSLGRAAKTPTAFQITNLPMNTTGIPVNLTFMPQGHPHVLSNTLYITEDQIGPKLSHAELVDLPATGSTLLIKFADSDLVESQLKKDQFQVFRQDTSGKFSESVSPQTDPILDGSTVRLYISNLPAGLYRLVVKGKTTADSANGSASAVAALMDHVGNLAGGGQDQLWEFSVVGERKFGKHVEFTPFAPPVKQAIPKEGFNPGDFVETRVARLYYYRDAHRVAEIINRNVRSYNQAAVTQAERRAEKSRDDANDKTDERRRAERDAVHAAEQARMKERQLADAKQTLATMQDLQNDISGDNALETEISRRLGDNKLDTPTRQALNTQLEAVKQRNAQNQQNLARLGGSAAATALASNVTSLEQTVASLRQTELVKQEAVEAADAKEARAKARQFRDEVTAAETDPDTYVAGDLNSVDPVTQVSISVIGEGLIQLRGPIKGVNKIRTMINEIDSPVGQIKIGIFSVQVNGEKGDKMEKVVGNAEGNVDLSRFLVNQSLNLLRRSIQSEAAAISDQCAMEGHYQVDRDRRYLYLFFGRDFIDELYAMNSEFLNTENKLLSLHSMDTVSLNRALFILALAKNDVRERVISRFLEASKTELADAEFDFRRSSELKPHKTEKLFPPWNRTHLPVSNHYTKEDIIFEAVHRNAQQRYHFRNFSSFFDTGFTNTDTMSPLQRQFVRLAQIFKARLVAEMELKQRVLERGLIEDRSNDEDLRFEILDKVHKKAIELESEAYGSLVEASRTNQDAAMQIELEIAKAGNLDKRTKELFAALENVQSDYESVFSKFDSASTQTLNAFNRLNTTLKQIQSFIEDYERADWSSDEGRKQLGDAKRYVAEFEEAFNSYTRNKSKTTAQALARKIENLQFALENNATGQFGLTAIFSNAEAIWKQVMALFLSYRSQAEQSNPNMTLVAGEFNRLDEFLNTTLGGSATAARIRTLLLRSFQAALLASTADHRIEQAKQISKKTRADLDHRKLLNHLIDEQEDKFIELVEGVRSHTAVMDDYLKRLSIAIEDDFKVQFYDPAFVRVRDAARACQVNLGQVERTTILTNNRAFAKVDPQATMEFDLPKRQIAIKEAFDAAKALVEDSGALMNDPTFLSAFQLMGGSKQPSTVKNLLPAQSQSLDQQVMGIAPQPQESGAPGSALQSLVPEPSVFKLETGTGFQIRPMMQPDGDSVVYDFDYMYTTNIREPVRPDEKHIGRIKRHFVHTAVQTGNFEIREISRYQVALKVSRTGQGVPLLQDIPVVGAAFRPAPSAESSIQQNIIFGQTNVYPTLFDLMGLRWAQQVVDLDHNSLMENEHVVRGRQKTIRDYVFGESSKRVDEFLDMSNKAPQNYRPDLYHSQSLPSPYHPNGHRYPNAMPDPTGNNYERRDIRPADMQEPPYERYRHQPASPERIGPQAIPESIPMNFRPAPMSPDEQLQGSSRRREIQPLNEYETTNAPHESPLVLNGVQGERNGTPQQIPINKKPLRPVAPLR